MPQPSTAADAQREIHFNQHIRPLLSDHCFACHGPDSASRKADLRLDTQAGAMADGVVVPGRAGESELIARITSDDPEFMMPPPGENKRVTIEDIRLLKRWIDDGAEWEEHWSFIKPQRPELPQPTGYEKWAGNPIDHFVFDKLARQGLKPNGPAEPHRLARRAALDLTGLPPDPATVDAYLSEIAGGSKSVWERYIDTLLKSQYAGEHRARFWLDAARYGDTHGMHVDNYREIWPYRDWVIGAFNSNMPFDQFVIEQIAGDLLPEASLEQLIATGFNRCNITTSEGGAIPEELDVRYMVDRVETTATVFLGLTAGCAVCHDHKYDPVSQREFYELGAFFNNTTQPAMDGNQKDTPPVVALPDEEFADEWNVLQAERKVLNTELLEWHTGASRWWPSRRREIEHPVATDELILWLPLTAGEGESLQLPASVTSVTSATNHPAGPRGVRFGQGQLSVDLPRLRSDQPLTLSFWLRTADELADRTGDALLQQTTRFRPEQTGDGSSQDKNTQPAEKLQGWKVTTGSAGNLIFELYDQHGDQISGELPDNEALRPRSWQHVCVRYSGGQSSSSISILVNGRAAALRNATEKHCKATDLADAPLKIGPVASAGISDLRIFRRWINDQEVQLLAEDSTLRELMKSDSAWTDLEAGDRDRLTRFYDQVIDDNYHTRARRLAATQRRQDYIYSRSTTTLVMQERPSAPRAWVLQRGEYDQRQYEVPSGVPDVLPELPPDVPANRLGLARWLVHPGHPLTARVTVNRLWQSLFGTGLVKTSEDFGVMGERPSHPELLDWLAVEFIESGWNVNHMLTLMTTSATYRQSSLVTPEKHHVDPENRMLSHGPRLRLEAEVLRDQALAVSGLLQRKIGGPGVRPYQPAGLWRVVAIVGSNTARFKQDSGDALYRRSLYTFWKRTSPPPSMAAFNAPTREQCTVRRERTNTPLQALVLMNGPQFVEAARHLAQRAVRGHSDDASRVKWMLNVVLARPPEQADVGEMLAAAAEFRDVFAQNPDGARKLIDTGDSDLDHTIDAAELAAWTMVANTLMNRDDFINN